MARFIDADLLIKNIANIEDLRTLSTKTIGEAISNTPTADVVEVKHGRWEKRTFIVFDNEIKDGYRCSECNTTWDTDTNYCPNCGVKMDGGGAE